MEVMDGARLETRVEQDAKEWQSTSKAWGLAANVKHRDSWSWLEEGWADPIRGRRQSQIGPSRYWAQPRGGRASTPIDRDRAIGRGLGSEEESGLDLNQEGSLSRRRRRRCGWRIGCRRMALLNGRR